nr:MAG TPA: hypothetical protein [Caudoviricetes sp.]
MKAETTKGKMLSPLELEVLGGVDVSDLVERTTAELQTSEAPSIARLRQIHHEIARLLASGLTETEVAASTGYSLSRISILKGDPSFKELLAYYAARSEEQFLDVRKRLAILGTDAVAELQDRLDYKPDSLTNTQLIEITKTTLDRAGFSPVSKSENVQVLLTGDELEKLKQNIGGGNVRIVESLSSDRRPAECQDSEE